MKKRVLCYGDSNTWGYVPVTGERYSRDVRWTGVLAKLLGEEYEILEEGLSGRTTVWEIPYAPCRSGLDGLGYCLLSQKPIDLVVMMLGTNDMNFTNAFGYYRGLGHVANQIINANIFYKDVSDVFSGEPKLLLVSPITLHPDIARIRPEIPVADKYAETCKFAAYTEQLARELNVPWVDAAAVAEASVKDAIHIEPEGHRAIAELLAGKIKEIL